MSLNSRVLTCSYNRRRNRIHPHNDESTMQTSKPKQNALKSRMEPQAKLLVVSENVSEWPCINKEIRTPSLESESSTQPSMFRRRIDFDDEDMFVLKRANPVYESDDEEYMASPAKRQRTSEPIVLDWCERLSEDEAAGYGLSLPILPPH
jgi:hypothetical protein